MAYEIKGLVQSVSPIKQVTEKFAKRELVIEVADGKYPQTLQFETSGDRNSLLDAVGPGDTVTIHFDLRGRKSQKDDRVWNTLNIWKLSVDTKATPRAAQSDQDSIPF